jgi:hypothetical protein
MKYLATGDAGGWAVPVKAANRIGRRNAMNFRTTDELRRRLEEAASRAGHSLTQELEDRIERSFDERDTLSKVFGGPAAVQFLTSLGAIIRAAQHYASCRNFNEVETRRMIAAAVRKLSETHLFAGGEREYPSTLDFVLGGEWPDLDPEQAGATIATDWLQFTQEPLGDGFDEEFGPFVERWRGAPAPA